MAAGDRVPFYARRNLLAVDALLNRTARFSLVVDTGAERLVISRTAAAALRLDLTRPLRFEPVIGVGSLPPVPVVRLDHVQVGQSEATGLIDSVFDLPPLFRADGLLGLNFLRGFRVTFEFDRRALVLRDLRPRAR